MGKAAITWNPKAAIKPETSDPRLSMLFLVKVRVRSLVVHRLQPQTESIMMQCTLCWYAQFFVLEVCISRRLLDVAPGGLKSQRLAIATRQGDTLVGNQHLDCCSNIKVVAATEHLKTAVSTVRQNRTGVYEVDHMESTACLDQNCQLVPGASLCEL